MPTSEPLRRTMAYVQFLSQLEDIKALLAQGYSKKLIHERLTEKNLISMAYVTFCQIMQKEFQNDTPATKEEKQTHNPTRHTPEKFTPSGPRIINSVKEPFPDPRKMRLEDGI